jgi:hypothetical protein
MRDSDGRITGLFDVDTPATPTVVMSWGLGVDSSYILARWLTDPTSRDFDLADLVVLTAMVGNEFAQTARDAETAFLPLLAAHGVRYIQVGRSRRNVTADGEGVVIFDDSRNPTTLHIGGDYTLGDELLTAATVPQIGGARRCSIKSKANVLTSDLSDWATNCPEYKVTAVQITPSNGPTQWQDDYMDLQRRSRRIAPAAEAAE